MATFSDDFNRADSADLGAVWDQQNATETAAALVSNAVRSTGTPGVNISAESYNGFTTAGDCYAKVTLTLTAAEANNGGVLLRAAAPSVRTFYVGFGSATAGTVIQLRNAGAGSTVNSNATNWATGDILEMRCTGANSIEIFKTGASVITGNDSTLTSGRIGLRAFSATALANAVVDDFEGGDLNIYMPISSWGVVQQAVARGAFF